MGTASLFNAGSAISTTANANNSVLTQRFATPTEGQSLFNLTAFSYVPGTHSLQIFIDGVAQAVLFDFTETSVNSFTIIGGVRASDVIDAVGIVGSTGAITAATSATAAAASAASAAVALATIQALNPPNLPLARVNGGLGQVVPAPVAGKVLGSSDGVTYSLLDAPISIASTVVGAITLTAVTIGYHAIAMAAQGLSITLPAANTLSIGGPKGIFDNTKGMWAVGIRDSTGTLIGAVAAGGEAYAALKDNGTVAGVWSLIGAVEPGLVTVDVTLPVATYAGNAMYPALSLTSDISIHFAPLAAGGFAAFVLDNVGKVVTTPVVVSATANDIPATAFAINATSCILFYGQSSAHKAVVLSLSGVVGAYVLAVGAPVSGSSLAAQLWAGENSVTEPKIVALSPTLYLAVSSDTANTAAFVLSVAGTVITVGATATVAIAAVNQANQVSLVPLTATTALLISAGSAPYTFAVISVAGTVTTINATVASVAPMSGSPASQGYCKLSATKVLFSANNTAANMYVALATIAGTVVTLGGNLLVEAGSYDSSVSTNAATRFKPRMYALSATSALFYYHSTANPNVGRVVVITEAAGVLSKGAVYLGVIGVNDSITAANGGTLGTLTGSTNEFISFIANAAYSTANGNCEICAFKITGNVITQGGVRKALNNYQPTTQSIVKLNGKYVMGDLTVFSSNGDAMSMLNKISASANSGIGFNYPLTVSGNRVIGTLTTSFNQPGGVNQIRLFNVEIAT